ncbi:MAG TPA: ABC transporter substrate-binding protein [Nitrospira sp.]|nr:ABC transporter substrate-binding protein [Nitrospira sp.]
MRICSLVPGATEVVAALGLADQLVAISHECNYPEPVRHARVVVEPVVDDRLGSRTIDEQVKEVVSSGRPLYRLNEEALMDAMPDIVLAQDLCQVCAVTANDLMQAVRALPAAPELLTLNPTSVQDVLNDIERIGRALGREAESRRYVASLRNRLAAVQQTSTRVGPAVLCLEWLSPLYCAGHWIPEMVQWAGGRNLIGEPARPSRSITWEEAFASDPDFVVVMPCGFSVERTMKELAELIRSSREWARAVTSWSNIFVVDAGSYFSRPGPRLVDGVELLAAILSGTYAASFDEHHVVAVSRSAFA